MSTSLTDFLASHPNLSAAVIAGDGSHRCDLNFPSVPDGRSFRAWLEFPKGFPNQASAIIRFASEHILSIPHVEADGRLCIGVGDPGPLSGDNPVDRLSQLLDSFSESFLVPWCEGWLDNDFGEEALNYWAIHCHRNASSHSAVLKTYTLDGRPADPGIYEGIYVTAKRIVFASRHGNQLVNRYVSSMAPNEQIRKALIAEIPIPFALTPQSWPLNIKAIHRLLYSRLGRRDAEKFINVSRHRKSAIHKIVLLRAPDCDFGFLLPGGPNTIIRRRESIRGYPSTGLLPLQVERLDPGWTCGRDQHSEVPVRQRQHILVVGAGALGSPVIEHLAKAGVGQITIIDNDSLSSANINRHVLGADSIGIEKAIALAKQLSTRYPSCRFIGVGLSVGDWLSKNTLNNIDLVLDLTGEPDVRMLMDNARTQHGCALVIGWFEPYVAAAHACMLPKGVPWLNGQPDRLRSLQAVEWPDDVIQREPSCSSRFQSYTAAAAAYGVGLVVESALDMLDKKTVDPIVRDWIRGQIFLDHHRPGLSLREWAARAAPFDGVSMERAL